MASIQLQSVSVDFPIYSLNTRSLKKHFLNLTTGGVINNQERKCVIIKALDDVSFQLHNGDRVGLIGHNGAGKSTLLRVLARIYEPTAGSMQIHGKVFPLFSLLLGFDQDSTGYENILMRGMLLGLSRHEIDSKIHEIAAFTELGDYLFAPIRTYSNGMQLRLAFAVTASIQPEILLLDEVLGTGDAQFMQKANKRLNELLDQSSIVLFASHSDADIQRICNKALLFTKGKIRFFDEVDEALAVYHGRAK